MELAFIARLNFSFYPLFPPGLSTNIDYTHADKLELGLAPDLFIIPSQLRHFVKNVDDVICINPAQYVKGATKGTFAEIFVQPLNFSTISEDSNIECIPNLLEGRARVDIVQ